ncbi:hypothetical protein ADL27_58795, partial [Streptomyces sp. NRRL F-6602]
MHSAVGAVAQHLGISSVRGRFTRFSGRIDISEDVARSQVSATIEAASIDTGNEMRDGHLRSADFLDVESYPELTYRSTAVVPAQDKPHFLARAWERVREEVENGHQAYVVCPRIGDEEEVGTKGTKKKAADEGDRRPPLAVLEVAEQLAAGPLAGLRIEVLHGRMAPDDKDDVMRRFAAGEVDVLVATTVIEVGVNVPNATAMVIMDADRFGVSQLHQLRGRVGRGSAPGLCLLVTDMPEAAPARARLGAVAATLDGFELSRIDLEQRREGDVLGQAQSGV